MKAGTVLACAALCLAAAGCAPGARQVCPLPGQSPAYAVRLYFGRDIRGGGTVSDADWAGFAAQVLTPAFPEGFSVYHAEGQWRAADGTVTREPSLVVERVGTIDPGKIALVIEAYRTRFRQEAVGVVSTPVCAAF
jgi:hypothetical protein